ncbi:hypothetical protein [Bacillus sp. NPDC094106]|uniref:hypothetical protein n=1 Tax=Bacillus sp. NPDC094106 TaxID=3363949 RepID=UPI003817B797
MNSFTILLILSTIFLICSFVIKADMVENIDFQPNPITNKMELITNLECSKQRKMLFFTSLSVLSAFCTLNFKQICFILVLLIFFNVLFEMIPAFLIPGVAIFIIKKQITYICLIPLFIIMMFYPITAIPIIFVLMILFGILSQKLVMKFPYIQDSEQEFFDSFKFILHSLYGGMLFILFSIQHKPDALCFFKQLDKFWAFLLS